MFTLVKMYALTVVVFFAIDIVWLGFVAQKVYAHFMSHLLRPQPNWPAAAAFYLIFIAGMIFFAIYPALKDGSLHKALLYGALYGFFTYCTYELTCLAVLDKWPLAIVFIDIAWGTVLSCSVSGAVFGLHKLIGS